MFWEQLTVDEFNASKEKTKGVCVIPLGCMEKHGNHLPLGTDVYIAREIVRRAAEKEEVMIFPYYPIGVIAEARHKQGTVAIPSQLQYDMLEAICEELSRNGYNKIILGNAHGGNSTFLRYFCQASLEYPRDYFVYYYDLFNLTEEQFIAIEKKHGPVVEGGHADITESACMLTIAPDQVKMDRVVPEQSKSLGRADWYKQHYVYTGINWYASYPHQFAGDPTGATAEMGEDILSCNAENFIEILRKIKEDDTLPKLMEEFYLDSDLPKC